jgi:hypothetical protein
VFENIENNAQNEKRRLKNNNPNKTTEKFSTLFIGKYSTPFDRVKPETRTHLNL